MLAQFSTSRSSTCAFSLALALSAALAGCSGSAPKVESVGVSRGAAVPAAAASTPGVGSGGADSLEFTLNLRNDNPDGVPLRVVDYTVEIDGQQVFSGTRSAEATVPARGVQSMRLPAAFEGVELRPGAKYRLSGSYTYVLPGAFAEALFDSGVRVPSASFAAEGELAQ